MASKRSKKKETAPVVYPVVTKGSHLTVYEMEDGKRILEWDEEALLRDVREAIASVDK